MTEKILFFFSALGVFNALLLGIYFLIIKPKRLLSDYFLGSLLIFLVIRVAVSCFYFFGPIPKEFIKLGLIANLLLGPMIMLLMQALINPQKAKITILLWHITFWVSCFTLLWFIFDFQTWNWKIRYVVHAVLTSYLVIAAFTWRKQIKSFITEKGLRFSVMKAIMLYLAVVATCLGFAVSLITSYILGPLIFSIVFYSTIAYFLLSDKKENKKTIQRKIDLPEFNKINQKLTQLMVEEKVYKNPDLKLESLAKQLSISRHQLSQLLNDHLLKNFHQYINDYRINEACQILKENKHYSIEAIGYEVGFHSRSSFFAAFKKKMGMTPSTYRKKS